MDSCKAVVTMIVMTEHMTKLTKRVIALRNLISILNIRKSAEIK